MQPGDGNLGVLVRAEDVLSGLQRGEERGTAIHDRDEGLQRVAEALRAHPHRVVRGGGAVVRECIGILAEAAVQPAQHATANIDGGEVVGAVECGRASRQGGAEAADERCVGLAVEVGAEVGEGDGTGGLDRRDQGADGDALIPVRAIANLVQLLQAARRHRAPRRARPR